MRKTLLISFFLVMFTIAMAQDHAVLPREYATIAYKAEYRNAKEKVIDFKVPASPVHKNAAFGGPAETQIGITQYDLQTNKLLGNRIYRFEDGTIGATWTMGLQATSFPDRGTGYNYFDGSSWGNQPTERIESVRTGWPSYAPLGFDGEVIVSHEFGDHVLYFNTREVKGEGVWNEFTFTYTGGPPYLSWPRIMTSGPEHNNVHLLANTFEPYEGLETATVYSRSTDGAVTWDIENIIIDGMGSDYYFDLPADEYVWAEPRNGYIAFLCASAWHDLFMMKSNDNGETWEKTVIWEHPYPFFDWNTTITDTFFCVDNSANIALDYDGKAHVVFGINRVLHDAVGTSYFLFPYIDGIGYWNEDMEPFSNDLDALAPPYLGYANSEMIEDYNYIGWMQDVDGDGEILLNTDIMYYRALGPSSMPTIYVDEDDMIVVLFASTTELYEYDVYNYKHIWSRTFYSDEWQCFIDLTTDIVHIFDECIYPQLAQSSDDAVYYMYNADLTPGVALDDAHGYQDNRQIFASVLKIDIMCPIGIEERNTIAELFTLSENHPNPCDDFTSFSIQSSRGINLILEIRNTTGQLLRRTDLGEVNGNLNYTLDVSSLMNGVYYYAVIGEGFSKTGRMVVR